MADSYRGVCVGAAQVVEDDQTGLIGIFTAANSKPVTRSAKNCAEMQSLSNARRAGRPELKINPFICHKFVVEMMLDFVHLGGDVSQLDQFRRKIAAGEA